MPSDCGKNAFGSRAEAKAWNRNSTLKALTPYPCPVCGLWHLTSQSKAEQRRIARRLGLR